MDFNPRTPCGVRLLQDSSHNELELFQSTHPLRGATEVGRAFTSEIFISIHAPLAGCDQA